MAIDTSFQTKQNSMVRIATEVTLGTAAVAGAAHVTMPVTDFSFSEIDQHALTVAPPRTGSGAYTQSDDMVRWDNTSRMFDISITFHSTAASLNRVCLNLFEDGDGTNKLLGSMPTTVDFKHGASNAVPVTLWFENAAHAGSGTDMIFYGCMCTSLTLTGDRTANGGVVMATATFQTGYDPTEAALTFTGSETTIASQSKIWNIHELATTTLASQELLLYSFDLTIARPINRISFDPDNNFRPMGYGLGGYEVTGNLTCKRDAESTDAIDSAYGQALMLDDTVFKIDAPKTWVDAAGISFDDDGWKQTIPFRCTYDQAATTNTVVAIHTVAD